MFYFLWILSCINVWSTLKSKISWIEGGNEWKEKPKSFVQDNIQSSLPMFFEFEGD